MNTWICLRDFSRACQADGDWTEAFRSAVAKLNDRDGGTLYVPAGVYQTRSVQLMSNMTLYLDNGAVVRFSGDIERYELIETEAEGRRSLSYKPLLFADHAENIKVCGQGTLDGGGAAWWKAQKERRLAYSRPCMVHFQYCRNVCLEDITIVSSPFWTVHPLYCDTVTVKGVTILNPPDSPNTDGIDPDGSRNVRITGCTIDVGDDCVAVKCGTEETPVLMSSENIVITGCTMLHGHGGVVLGSEMSGGIRNVVISNCIFCQTDRGIRIKTRRRRGGTVEDITVSNLIMEQVLCPFVINLFYWGGRIGKQPFVRDRNPHPLDEGTPAVRNLLFQNIIVRNASSAAGFLYGLPERHIENIRFSDCTITMQPGSAPQLPAMLEGVEPMSAAGFFVRNACGVVFHNVTIKNVSGSVYDLDSTAGVSIR